MINEAKNPLGLQNLDAGTAGWDAIVQDAVEALAPQDKLHFDLGVVLQGAAGPMVQAVAPIKNPNYTFAGLPSAVTFQDCTVIVTNSAHGRVPAYSDGANWRYFSDDAIVTT